MTQKSLIELAKIIGEMSVGGEVSSSEVTDWSERLNTILTSESEKGDK